MSAENKYIITVTNDESTVIRDFLNIIEDSPIFMNCDECINLMYAIAYNEPLLKDINILYK